MTAITLKGRIFITFEIKAVTGLHIGGTDTNIEIGGVDKTVIRDVLTNKPYIPGSSLKGKMRSLLEKYKGLEQNKSIGSGKIHSCTDRDQYPACPVCQIFGVPGELKFATPTRLVVRDIHLTDASANKLENDARTDLPYTESKTEVSIDRVTSAANPRQMERVPAGSVFGPAELVYTVYDGQECGCDAKRDVKNLTALVEGLQLLEDDYLGGLGSRGSGKVKLQNLEVKVKSQGNYLGEAQSLSNGKVYTDLSDLIEDLGKLQESIKKELNV